MLILNFLIFIVVIFSIYGSLNYYVFATGSAALVAFPEWHGVYVWVFWIVALSWLVGRLIERVRISFLSSTLIWCGSFWLAALVYFFLISLAVDLVGFVNGLVPFVPASVYSPGGKLIAFVSAVALVFFLVLGGAINARTPRIKSLNLPIAKDALPMKSFTIVSVSDIHLGTIICKKRLDRIVKKINGLDADLVLLPGDVVDEDIRPVIRQNLGESLRQIRSKHGVYAITGNHEYIGGVEPACAYLTEHGIRMLRDDVALVADSLYIVGREDVSYNRASGGKRRKKLEELLAALDSRRPIVLMDHQPFRLQEAESNGVDLQLSGHTHHGQIWPFSLITKQLFEVSWGYKKKGNTHFYVSCGAGSWGPPVRIGNSPEIMHITLSFNGQNPA